MLVFSNSKINLGLWILNKRSDGYHNIETIFYPILWQDIIEVIPNSQQHNQIEIFNYGLQLNIQLQENIIFKAYQLLLKKFHSLPSIKVYLYKQVPFGAGLGAGSANAAYFIKICNEIFELQLSKEELFLIASQLGADCAFFIENRVCLAKEKGDVLFPISLDLSSYYILIIYPNINISTKEAYQNCIPKERDLSLIDVINKPIYEWRYYLENDFEKNIYDEYPLIKKIKEKLYQKNAIYSSMSGSGSAVFGIFENTPELDEFKEYPHFLQLPKIQYL